MQNSNGAHMQTDQALSPSQEQNNMREKWLSFPGVI